MENEISTNNLDAMLGGGRGWPHQPEDHEQQVRGLFL